MSQSVRAKYKDDYEEALKEYKATVKNHIRAVKEHKSKFSAYYKLRSDYEKVIKAIGEDRYRSIADGRIPLDTLGEKDKKLLAMTNDYYDRIRDMADGELGVALDDDQKKLIGPAVAAKKLAQTKMEKALDTLNAYIETKSKLKTEDPAAYKEWKKLVREGLGLK